jgi:hypothetical protein
MSFFGKVIETVYRCDSAAVVAGAYHCGSLTREALYQGVEVVYKCDGDGFRAAAGDLYARQCYCGDTENDQVEFVASKNNAASSPKDALEGRNDLEDGMDEGTPNIQRVSTDVAQIQRAISATLSFEDSILNGPNSINELSSTASSLLDSVASEAKPNTKVGEERPVTPTMSAFCF